MLSQLTPSNITRVTRAQTIAIKNREVKSSDKVGDPKMSKS